MSTIIPYCASTSSGIYLRFSRKWLGKLYAMLDGIPEDNVYLGTFFKKGGAANCGTIACTAGWASIYPPFLKELDVGGKRSIDAHDSALHNLFLAGTVKKTARTADDAFGLLFQPRWQGAFDLDGHIFTHLGVAVTDKQLALARISYLYHYHT